MKNSVNELVNYTGEQKAVLRFLQNKFHGHKSNNVINGNEDHTKKPCAWLKKENTIKHFKSTC